MCLVLYLDELVQVLANAAGVGKLAHLDRISSLLLSGPVQLVDFFAGQH